MHGNPDKKIIIVDEVQKVPDILSAVHSLIEEKLNKIFVLTGSSVRKLKRTGIDLLAGREDILLAFKLPVFARKAQRALVSHQKFYLFDTGVFQSLRPKGPLDRPEEIAGAALEGLLAQHLRAWNAYKGSPSTAAL